MCDWCECVLECAWYHNTFLVHLSLASKAVLYYDELWSVVMLMVFVVTGGNGGFVCLQIPPGKLVRLMTVLSWNIRDGTKVTPFVNQVGSVQPLDCFFRLAQKERDFAAVTPLQTEDLSELLK